MALLLSLLLATCSREEPLPTDPIPAPEPTLCIQETHRILARIPLVQPLKICFFSNSIYPYAFIKDGTVYTAAQWEETDLHNPNAYEDCLHKNYADVRDVQLHASPHPSKSRLNAGILPPSPRGKAFVARYHPRGRLLLRGTILGGRLLRRALPAEGRDESLPYCVKCICYRRGRRPRRPM